MSGVDAHTRNSSAPRAAPPILVPTFAPRVAGRAALVLSLCRHLREKHSLAVVTNDIFTKVLVPLLAIAQRDPASR